MVSGKYSALSGAITREQSIANTSANLANISTVGFKKTRMSFESILKGEQQITDAQGINYNRVKGNYIDFSQGPIKETDNPFDIAINGDGFFKIRGPQGDLLTRKGNFALDGTGRLLTDTGMPVLNNGGGEIFIRGTDTNTIVIDQTGNIIGVNADGEQTDFGRLAIVDVDDKTLLKNEHDTSYSLQPGALEVAAENFSVAQGSLEISNVNMTDEMTRMINDNRIFQAYHSVLESYSKLGEKLEALGTLG
jgi:flagellar basal-body rod protein FlgF/flagellar basal-body rod protein FlgG